MSPHWNSTVEKETTWRTVCCFRPCSRKLVEMRFFFLKTLHYMLKSLAGFGTFQSISLVSCMHRFELPIPRSVLGEVTGLV